MSSREEEEKRKKEKEIVERVKEGLEDKVELLLKEGVDPNCRDEEDKDKPPLVCIAKGHVKTLKILLQYKANSSLTDEVCLFLSFLNKLLWFELSTLQTE